MEQGAKPPSLPAARTDPRYFTRSSQALRVPDTNEEGDGTRRIGCSALDIALKIAAFGHIEANYPYLTPKTTRLFVMLRSDLGPVDGLLGRQTFAAKPYGNQARALAV